MCISQFRMPLEKTNGLLRDILAQLWAKYLDLVPEQQGNNQGVNEVPCDGLANTQISTNLNYPNEGFLCHH